MKALSFFLSILLGHQVFASGSAQLELGQLIQWSRFMGEREITAPRCIDSEEPGDFVLDGSSPFCEEMPIGSTMIVNITRANSESGIPLNYRMSRMGQNSFNIGVNPVFWRNAETRVGFFSFSREVPHGQEYWRQKMTECFAEVNPIRSGGKMINLQLDTSAPEIPIQYTETPGRAHSAHYRSNTQCSTIVHEVFHVMGLPDEYHERDNDLNTVYPARRLGDDTNVMVTTNNSVVREYGYYVLQGCESRAYVDRNGQNINTGQRFLDSYREALGSRGDPFAPFTAFRNLYQDLDESQKTCAATNEHIRRIPITDFDLEIGDVVSIDSVERSLDYRIDALDFDFIVVDKVEQGDRGGTFLREDQLNTFLYPNCREKNREFYQCAIFAYRRANQVWDRMVPQHCRGPLDGGRKK